MEIKIHRHTYHFITIPIDWMMTEKKLIKKGEPLGYESVQHEFG